MSGTKPFRLLYVAVARARDQLYLASPLKDAALVPGRGSLAEVLPESMKAFFVRALAVFDQVDTLGWTGVSRTRIQLGVVPSPDAHAPTAVSTVTIATPASAIDDFAPPAAAHSRRRYQRAAGWTMRTIPLFVSIWMMAVRDPIGSAAS